jgi:hypothetical protein
MTAHSRARPVHGARLTALTVLLILTPVMPADAEVMDKERSAAQNLNCGTTTMPCLVAVSLCDVLMALPDAPAQSSAMCVKEARAALTVDSQGIRPWGDR